MSEPSDLTFLDLGDGWPNLTNERRARLLEAAQQDGQPWTTDQAESGWTDHMAEVMYGRDIDDVLGEA